MRLREMRRGQRERSGNWRADYLETRTVGSEEGGWKRAARAVPRQPPILLSTSVLKNEKRTAFFNCSLLQLSEGLCVHFELYAMIWIQIVKKLFFKLSYIERAIGTLLKIYESSTLQRYGNNHILGNRGS